MSGGFQTGTVADLAMELVAELDRNTQFEAERGVWETKPVKKARGRSS
jgi:hypothetical protein